MRLACRGESAPGAKSWLPGDEGQVRHAVASRSGPAYRVPELPLADLPSCAQTRSAMHPLTQPAPTRPARHRPSAARVASPAAVAACVAVGMALAAIPLTAAGGLHTADDDSPARAAAAAARTAATFTLSGDWPIPPSAGAEVVAATSLCPNIGAPTGVPGAGFAANGVLHVVATCYNRPQLSAIDPDGRIVWGGMLGWNAPSVVTFEPFTQRVVGAFRETAGRLVVAAHPVAGSAYPQRTWNVPGGDGDDRGLPLAMAPGPGGRVVARFRGKPGRFPGAARGSRASPGTAGTRGSRSRADGRGCPRGPRRASRCRCSCRPRRRP